MLAALAEPAHGAGRHHHHHHHADHHHANRRASVRALAWGVTLTISMMVIEGAVGFFSGSLALLADAAHMLADASALVLALLAQQWASKGRSQKSTFGYRRAEVLAAFVNGILLSVTSIWIVKEAVERWLAPRPVLGLPMFVTAVAGLAINLGVAGLLLGARAHSLNVRAAFLHVLTDAIGSMGAIAAAIAVWAFGLMRADPVLSVGISVLVAYSGWRVLRETMSILLESAPEHLDVEEIQEMILECPGVMGVHDLHVWRISDEFDALTVHVTIERGSHGVEVCRTIAERLKKDFGLHHATVQPEAAPPEEFVALRLGRDAGPSKSS